MQHLEIHYAIAPLVIPLIAAGASMLGNWFANKQSSDSNQAINDANIKNQNLINTQNRNWAIEDFNKTNAYNSPLQQMQRLREGGLNPNLVYGNGAQNTAAMVKNTQAQAPQLTPSHFAPLTQGVNIANDLQAGYNLKKIQAETDNTNEAIQLMKKEELLKDQTIAGSAIANKTSQFSYDMGLKLADQTIKKASNENELTSAQTAKTNIEAAYVGPKFDLERLHLKLEQAKNAPEVAQILAETLRAKASTDKERADIDKIISENTLLKQTIELQKQGITWHDNMFIRSLIQLDPRLHKLSDAEFNKAIIKATPKK